jgi:ubiquinone/menaquinone biosynthesis C-methylase UbiE
MLFRVLWFAHRQPVTGAVRAIGDSASKCDPCRIWAREYFERGYTQRWGLQAPSDELRLQAGSLWNLLQLCPASRVIDIGCSHGRHALALASCGADVVGLDFSVALLNRARDLTAELQTRVRWVRGDMRRLPFRSECASAAVLIDPFGFFDSEAEHEAVLREAARVLTTRGRLALKVVNGGPILTAFRESDREERDGVVVCVSNTLTMDPPRMIQKISVSGPRGQGEYERRQRLYRVEDLAAAFERAGFAIVGVFASPDGASFEPTVSSTIWMQVLNGSAALRGSSWGCHPHRRLLHVPGSFAHRHRGQWST